MSRSTRCTSSAIRSSSSKSSPKILIPMSDRMPETISFMRNSIGCVNTILTPGNCEIVFSISITRPACVSALVHSARGLSDKKMSVSSIPIGSVATSAVPIRLQMCSISSGKSSSSTSSIRVLYRTDSSIETPASRMVFTTIEPSLSRGMNSPPICVLR